MVDGLQQAQAAAQQQDWSLVNQYLERFIAPDRSGRESASPEPTNPDSETAEDADTQTALDLAIQSLVDGDFQSRWDAAKLVPKFGNAAIAPLIDLVQDEDCDDEVRWFAARLLGDFNAPEVVLVLAELLQTAEDDELQAIAASALANLGSTAIQSLADLLDHPDVQLSAVQALSQIRTVETIEPLLRVVDSPQPQIRAITVEALGSFHHPAVTPVLLKGLADTASTVRREALVGLSRRRDLLNEIDLVAHIQPCLLDLNLDVCGQAMVALGRLGTDAAAKALQQVLHSPNTPMPLRVNAARTLSWIESQTALDGLAEGLKLEQDDVQVEIVRGLSQIQDTDLRSQAAPLLAHAMTHPSFSDTVRQAAALGLGQLDQDTALEPLIQLLADTNSAVRFHAIAALKQLNPNAAFTRLQELQQQLDENSALGQGVAIALREW
ncbi:MAG: HEAT repeat domain-containing protein [Thainema sp.]